MRKKKKRRKGRGKAPKNHAKAWVLPLPLGQAGHKNSPSSYFYLTSFQKGGEKRERRNEHSGMSPLPAVLFSEKGGGKKKKREKREGRKEKGDHVVLNRVALYSRRKRKEKRGKKEGEASDGQPSFLICPEDFF